MIVHRGTKTLYVDIDNTLALWNGDKYYPNKDCITLIKQFYARGHILIAWSAGGAEWAEQVVTEFDLSPYFTACLSKPDWFIDDKHASEFMPELNRIILTDKLDSDPDNQ